MIDDLSEKYRKRTIQLSDKLKEFYLDVDGYVYWWPDGSHHGHLASHHLRWLADELDRRNKKWDDQIKSEIGSA